MEITYDITTCPTCGRKENTAMIDGTVAVMWCCCGAIYKLKFNEEGMILVKDQLGTFN